MCPFHQFVRVAILDFSDTARLDEHFDHTCIRRCIFCVPLAIVTTPNIPGHLRTNAPLSTPSPAAALPLPPANTSFSPHGKIEFPGVLARSTPILPELPTQGVVGWRAHACRSHRTMWVLCPQQGRSPAWAVGVGACPLLLCGEARRRTSAKE